MDKEGGKKGGTRRGRSVGLALTYLFTILPQDCFFEDSGAYTGSVSTCMLKVWGAGLGRGAHIHVI